jgi:hypothetical protein
MGGAEAASPPRGQRQGKLSPGARAAWSAWLADRGLEGLNLRALGCEAVHRPALGGWCVAWPYCFTDGTTATRLLALELPDGPGWRNDGPVKGAVMALGDLGSAARIVIAEGESDGLAAWKVLEPARSEIAVLSIPGAGMVGADLANWIGNGARVVIATDADRAGTGAPRPARRRS